MKYRKKSYLVKIMKNPCKMPVRMSRYTIQPKIQTSHQQMEKPKFSHLESCGL